MEYHEEDEQKRYERYQAAMNRILTNGPRNKEEGEMLVSYYAYEEYKN